MNRQIGWSTESNLLWQIGNQIDRMTGVIGSTLSTFVPQSRTLTINGVTYDLSANRSWTVAAGLSGTIATGQVAFGSALNTIAGSNTFFWDNTNSYLYLGTNVSSFAFGHKIRAVGQGDASIGIFRNQASASPSKLEFFKSRGTYLVPLANSANDQLMSISAFGWGSASTQYVNAVAISAVATSIGTNGVQGQLNLTTWNNTGSNFSSLSLKNSFSAPGSGGVVTIGADASGITPLGTLHVRGFDATTSNNVVYLENSTQTQLAKLSNDGQFLIGTGAFTGQRLQVAGQSIFSNPPAYQIRISDGTFKWDLWAVANVSNTDLRFVDNNGVNAMILYQGGNVSIGNNNSNARLSITGAGATLSTNALLIQDSGSNNLFSFRNNGTLTIPVVASQTSPVIQIHQRGGIINNGTYVPILRYGNTIDDQGQHSQMYGFWSSGNVSGFRFNHPDGSGGGGVTFNFIPLINQIQSNVVNIQQNLTTTSGSQGINQLLINPTINQTGGSTGITRGFYIQPTLTSIADWRSIEWSNNTGFGLYGAGTAPNYLGGDLTVVGVFRETVTTNRQTASYSLVLLDRGKLVEMNVASANNLTVPLDSAIAFPVGTKIDISQYGAGQTTVVATGGVTVRSAAGALKLAAQYSGATLVKIATNEWYLFGDITT
jgi:hypothetical protein